MISTDIGVTGSKMTEGASRSGTIEVFQLRKEYATRGGSAAVDDISFTIEQGELRTLLGPSGCGKTTTLRMLAGLERPTSGEIRIGGRVVYSSEKGIWVPANRRRIGMVFQSYAIWPHMSVFENVAFPLRIARPRLSGAEVKRRTLDALDAVGLAQFAKRTGTELSGGQQQRAVLARAIVREPDVLLLDEPLSNLDVKLRDRMRDWIREVQERTGLTTVFVTHDQSEALGLSDRISVMNFGRIVETGEPEQIYREPRDPFTAVFVGTTNRLPGWVESIHDGVGKLVTPMGAVDVVLPADARVGDAFQAFVRPEDLEIVPADGRQTSAVLGSATYQGSHWDVVVRVGDTEIRVRLYRSPSASIGANVGLHIRAGSFVPGFRPEEQGIEEKGSLK